MGSLEYEVRRSDRARRVRIYVRADGVEVVVPRRASLSRVAPLVEEKRGWIERTLERLRHAEAALPRPRLEDGGSVPYLGRWLALGVTVDGDSRRPRVHAGGGRLAVTVAEPGPAAVRDALEPWYRERARAEVRERLDSATARAGRRYARLEIRAQRTRWASCSPSGTMSFNWRLLLAPEVVLDYVVEHEVAHVDVPDHSPRFWALLESRCPGAREHERWLRHHGAALTL